MPPEDLVLELPTGPSRVAGEDPHTGDLRSDEVRRGVEVDEADPNRCLTPRGSGSSPGTVTRPIAELSSTGPPWNIVCGEDAMSFQPGRTASMSASIGRLRMTPWAPSSSWCSSSTTDAPERLLLDLRRGHEETAGEERPHVVDHGASLASDDARRPQVCGRRASWDRDCCLRAGATSARTATTVVGTATRSTGTAGAAPRALLRLEEAAVDVVGHGDAGRGTTPGVGDHRVARHGLDRYRVDTGVAQLALHGAALVREGERDDGAGLAGPSGTARAVQVVLVVGRRVDVDAPRRRRRRGCRERRHRWRRAPGACPRGTRRATRLRAPCAQTAVQRGREDALLAQLLGDAVGAVLGADEDQCGPAVRDLGRDDLLVLRVDEEHVVVHRRDRAPVPRRRSG